MKRLLIGAMMAAAMSLATPAMAFDGVRYGDVHVAQPKGPSRGYVMLFSDHGGWSGDDQAALDALATQGELAVGVDLDIYLARLAPGTRPCSELIGDVEGLSQKLQRAETADDYHFPILAGIGAGGALAQMLLAAAPPNTVAGAATLNPDIAPPNGLACSLPSTIITSTLSAGLEPLKSNGFWTVGLTPGVSDATRLVLQARQGVGTPIDIHPDMPANPAEALAALISPHLDHLDLTGLDAIPLITLPVAHASRLMAVLLSGDGGWRDIDKTIGDKLQSYGVPVVGFDSLRYFWRLKTPQRTAQDLTTVIRAYQTKWHVDKVALIGYSFGANVLPAVYNALPTDIKNSVTLVSLLGLETKADWEIKISGWFGASPSDAATPVAAELQKIPGPLIQCFYGEDQTDTGCPSLAASGAEIVQTKGGHHFNGDYSTLTHKILDGFQRRAGSAG